MLPASVPVMPAPVLGLIPDAGTVDPGTFLKGSGSGSVYVLRDGLRRGIGAWADLIALNGGDPAPRILQIDQRVADLLPLGTPGNWGRARWCSPPRSATVYFVNGPGGADPGGLVRRDRNLGATRASRLALVIS